MTWSKVHTEDPPILGATVYLQGADKSLARPGRKQANVSFITAWISFGALPCRRKKKTWWWQLASRRCWNHERPRHASEPVSFLVGLRTCQDRGSSRGDPAPGICEALNYNIKSTKEYTTSKRYVPSILRIYWAQHCVTRVNTSTLGSRFATVRFTTIHFYDPCLVAPSTPDLWCITVATQASFLYLLRF